MKKFLVFLCAVMLVFGVVGVAGANLLNNGDFETGDLTGWTSSGDVDVVNFPMSSLPGWLASVQGMDGNFALLGCDTESGDSTLSQSFTVSGATSITLAFDYAFDFVDLNPWSDDTFVAITTYKGDVVGEITMLDLSSSLIGANYGHYEKTFDLNPAWSLDANMSFTLSEIGGFLSGGTFSMAAIDNVTVNAAPVPIPSAGLLLLGSGLLGIVGFGRKRLTKKA